MGKLDFPIRTGIEQTITRDVAINLLAALAKNLLASLANFVPSIRYNFNELKPTAKEKYPEVDYQYHYQRKELEVHG